VAVGEDEPDGEGRTGMRTGGKTGVQGREAAGKVVIRCEPLQAGIFLANDDPRRRGKRDGKIDAQREGARPETNREATHAQQSPGPAAGTRGETCPHDHVGPNGGIRAEGPCGCCIIEHHPCLPCLPGHGPSWIFPRVGVQVGAGAGAAGGGQGGVASGGGVAGMAGGASGRSEGFFRAIQGALPHHQ